MSGSSIWVLAVNSCNWIDPRFYVKGAFSTPDSKRILMIFTAKPSLIKFYKFILLISCGYLALESGPALSTSVLPERIEVLMSCKNPELPVSVCKLIDEFTPDEKVSMLIRTFKTKKRLYAIGSALCLPMMLTCPVTCLLNFFCCDGIGFCHVSCQSPIMLQKHYFLKISLKLLRQIEIQDKEAEPLAVVLNQPNQNMESLRILIRDNFSGLSKHPDYQNIFENLLGVEWPDSWLDDE